MDADCGEHVRVRGCQDQRRRAAGGQSSGGHPSPIDAAIHVRAEELGDDAGQQRGFAEVALPVAGVVPPSAAAELVPHLLPRCRHDEALGVRRLE
jgi:hypothetical protein